MNRKTSHRSEMAELLVVVWPQWLHNDCSWHGTNCCFKIGIFASRTISPGANGEHNHTVSDLKVKGKVDHATPGRRWGAHLPLIAVEPIGG